MFKRVLMLMLATAVYLMCLTGCNPANQKNISAVIGPDPGSLDPAFCDSAEKASYIGHLYEGLFKLDEKNNLQHGVIESYDMSADGLRYTFRLKDGIKWSDGRPVTARDFEYAWKRILNPATGSQLAPMLYCLKNGKEYNLSQIPEYKGKKAAESDVGVRAKDDKTLEVLLETPAPYFPMLTTYAPFMPVREDVIEKYGNKWAKSVKTFTGNGPFSLEKWENNKMMILKKNSYYPDKEKIIINNIKLYFENSPDAALAGFKSGRYDIVYGLVPSNELEMLKTQKSLTVRENMTICYLNFNTTVSPFNDMKVRKAMTLALDREFLTSKVAGRMDTPATAWIPPGIAGEKNGICDFRTEANGYVNIPKEGDIARAKNLLAEAGYPDGKGFPEVNLIYTEDTQKEFVESMQEQWRKNLGINVKIYNKSAKEFNEMIYWKKHALAVDTMTGMYDDAIAFLDTWVGGGQNNKTGWSNAMYDDLINKALTSSISSERMKALHDAEKLLMDEVPVSPLYWSTTKLLQKNGIKGLIYAPNGTIYMHYITKE